MAPPELTMEQVLAIIGDLELERRRLLRHVGELEAKLAAREAEETDR